MRRQVSGVGGSRRADGQPTGTPWGICAIERGVKALQRLGKDRRLGPADGNRRCHARRSGPARSGDDLQASLR